MENVVEGQKGISKFGEKYKENKQKAWFVRGGGPPVTTPGFPPFQRGGPMAEIAARLRYFKSEVVIQDWSVIGVQKCDFFFSSRRRHTRLVSDWSSDVCSSD